MLPETKKLLKYGSVFGENVRLVINLDGSGWVEIGVRDAPGFFIDSFDDLSEFVKKDPKETQRKAKEWNWI
jgi:hypothetical protein